MIVAIHWPQAILVGLSAFGMVLTIRNHDKPRSNENAWTSLVGLLITYGLLIWGGFFK
jgi:hypothetical protein